MEKNKQYNVALVLFTHGIDYDDRIRKEILSIQKLSPNVSFKIFAVESGKNREESGVSSYGVPYRIPYLKSRDKYSSGSHRFAKAWDFYKTIKDDLKPFDAIWCADPETFMAVLMITGKPIVWDLHELPLAFMHNPILKSLFMFLERKVTVMIHANQSRLDYLKEIGLVKHTSKQFVLRNYPQFNEIDNEYDDTYQQFIKWKGETKCVYLQGLNNNSRAAEESIKAVLSFEELKGVVVGGFDERIKTLLEDEYGKDYLRTRIFFLGKVKQLKTPQYIRQCCLSLVFYKDTSPNNWYCEPNRLFQSVINGIPVVTGNNPPLRTFVESHNFGVSVNTDGADIQEIEKGIDEVLSNYEFYKQNTNDRHNFSLWDSQEGTIMKVLEKCFE